MSGDVTVGYLKKLSYIPGVARNGRLIGGQDYFNVYFTGGAISGVTFSGTDAGALQANDLIPLTRNGVAYVVKGSMFAGGGGGGTWGSITGTLSAQTDLQTALNGKAGTTSSGNTFTSTTVNGVTLRTDQGATYYLDGTGNYSIPTGGGGGGGGGSWGSITGTLSDQTDLQTALNAKCATSAVINQPLTGFSAGAGTVAATDSILQAINKIVGNIAGLGGLSLSSVLTGLSTASKAVITSSSTIIQAFGQLQAQITNISAIGTDISWIAPANGTFTIRKYCVRPYTITDLKGCQLTAGSLTLTISINGTPITGLSGLSITTLSQNFTATAANTLAVGDVLTITVASATGPAAGLTGTLVGA